MTVLPPRPTPYIEFANKGTHGACLHLQDSEGRPLGERSAPACAKEGLRIDDKISNYRGREGRLMNYSGYRQVMGNMAPAMSALATMRKEYCSLFGVSELSIAHLWRFSRIVSSVPLYLNCRRQSPVLNGDLSVIVSTLFKIGAGPFLTSAQILVDARPGAFHYREKITPEEYLRYTEDRGIFNIDIDNGTCAAPPRLILDFLGSVMHGFAEEPEPVDSAISDLINESSFFRYASLCLMQDYMKIAFTLKIGAIYADLVAGMVKDPQRGLKVGEIVAGEAGWIFGIGQPVFDSSIFTSMDPGKLSEHAKHLRRVAATVELEISEIETSIGLKNRFSFTERSGSSQTYTMDGRAAATELLALERFMRLTFDGLEGLIADSLGWGVTPISDQDFMRGSEIPHFSSILIDISSGITYADFNLLEPDEGGVSDRTRHSQT